MGTTTQSLRQQLMDMIQQLDEGALDWRAGISSCAGNKQTRPAAANRLVRPYATRR